MEQPAKKTYAAPELRERSDACLQCAYRKFGVRFTNSEDSKRFLSCRAALVQIGPVNSGLMCRMVAERMGVVFATAGGHEEWPAFYDGAVVVGCKKFRFADTVCVTCTMSALCLYKGRDDFMYKPHDCPWL